MKLFRISNVLILVLATGLGGALFWTSQMVQTRQDKLAIVTAQANAERESLNVLSTEWDYLNRPQRLEQLARDFLSVVPPKEQRIVTDVAVIAEPAVPIIPPSKPAIIPAMVKPAAPVISAPAPSPTIHQADSQKFETLLSTLSGGNE